MQLSSTYTHACIHRIRDITQTSKDSYLSIYPSTSLCYLLLYWALENTGAECLVERISQGCGWSAEFSPDLKRHWHTRRQYYNCTCIYVYTGCHFVLSTRQKALEFVGCSKQPGDFTSYQSPYTHELPYRHVHMRTYVRWHTYVR